MIRFFAGILFIVVSGATDLKAQFIGCRSIDQITLEACNVLEKLFLDTDGYKWRNSRGWLQSNQPCDWFGVTCRSSEWPREIIHIDLSSNNLTGVLPGDLALLSELISIRVDNSGPGVRLRKLTSIIPASLGDLKHLEILSLSHNAFTGAIPSELGNLINLRELDLGANHLTGPIPERLGQLADLQHLDLSENKIGGAIPDTLKNLSQLQHLNLRENVLSGTIPKWIGQLELLKFLDLSTNQMYGAIPEEISQLAQIIWLSLANNNFSGALPLSTVSFASQITNCHLGETQLCIPDTLPYARFTQVCSLTPKRNCNICQGPHCESMRAFYQSTNGEAWTQSDGWLATSDPCQWYGIRCNQNGITSIILPSNNLSGHLPHSLSSLQNLRSLDLSKNRLQGDLPEEYGEFNHLTSLDLSSNQLTGVLPLDFAILGTQLDQCNLSMNAGICVPSTDEYSQLRPSLICELPKRSDCVGDLFVQLTDLSAVAGSRSVELSWSTPQPSSTITFVIERTNPYLLIDQVSGSSTAPMTFTHTLNNLDPGLYSFQIRQVTSSGTTQLSEPITVELHKEDLVIHPAYPNPFSSETGFEFVSGTHGSVAIELYDLLGRQVRTLFRGTPTLHTPVRITISSANLSNGVYFIHSSLNEHRVSSQQILHIQ